MPPDTKHWLPNFLLLNTLFIRVTAATGWLVLSCYLLLTPSNSFTQKGILSWLLTRLGLAELQRQLPIDKLIHATIFFGLVFLWHRVIVSWPLPTKEQRRWTLLNASLWICMAIGAEYAQESMQLGRQFEYADMISNVLGWAAGLLVTKKLTPVETGVATKTNCL
jgi:hypothetical protein